MIIDLLKSNQWLLEKKLLASPSFLICYRDIFVKLLTASTAFSSTQQQKSNNDNTTMSTPATIPTTGGGTTSSGTGVLAAGAHMPILHLATSLPAPSGEVPTVLHGTSLEEQQKQATELHTFLTSTPNPNLQ